MSHVDAHAFSRRLMTIVLVSAASLIFGCDSAQAGERFLSKTVLKAVPQGNALFPMDAGQGQESGSGLQTFLIKLRPAANGGSIEMIVNKLQAYQVVLVDFVGRYLIVQSNQRIPLESIKGILPQSLGACELPLGKIEADEWFHDMNIPERVSISRWNQEANDVQNGKRIEGPIRALVGSIGNNAANGTISGIVTAAGGAGVRSVYVNVYDFNIMMIMSGSSDSTGAYSISVPAGTYKIFFNASDTNRIYGSNVISAWFNNKSVFVSADTVTVASSGTTTVDAVLSTGGIVSGAVTDGDGASIKDVEVCAYDLYGVLRGRAYSNTSGTYTLAGLSNGPHKIFFKKSGLQPLWYDNKNDFSGAETIIVAVGETRSNINAILRPLAAGGNAISGTITNSSGIGIERAGASVYDQNQKFVASGKTNTLGEYIVGGLKAGTYKVLLSGGNANYDRGNAYLSEWYNDKASFAAADSVSVADNVVTQNINAQLASGGIITGTSNNLVRVIAYDLSGNSVGSGSVDYYPYHDYVYEIKPLVSGAYKVYFDPSYANSNNHDSLIPRWFNDKPDFNGADPVSVTIGNTTPNIDGPLSRDGAGGIFGTVTNGSGVKLDRVSVAAYDINQKLFLSTSTYYSGGYIGSYWLGGLPAGSYKLYFSKDGFSPEWYANKQDFASADPVVVTSGNETTGIDASLESNGSIYGLVTKTGTGEPVGNLTVRLFGLDQTEIKSTATNEKGEYTVRPPGPGTYKLYYDAAFLNAGYGTFFVSEWYNNQASFGAATSVSVALGLMTSGIDAELATIPAPSLVLTAPNGGESWVVASNHNITWTTTGTVANVKIEYSIDSGVNWTTVIASTSNAGTYSWNVPNTPAATCLVRISDAGNAAVNDVSNAVFTIAAAAFVKENLLGTWDGQGVYYRSSDTGLWTILSTAADLIACGDLYGDGVDDLIGIWSGQAGVWVKNSANGSWAYLGSTPRHIAAGDMNGDGETDLLGTWDGQGVFYQVASGNWTMMATAASLITTGDLDGDGTDDLVGIWPGQAGVWVKMSQSGSWSYLGTSPRDMATGDMNGDGRADLIGTWDGQGVYYRDSITGTWVMMATPADQIAAGDLDGDGTDDLIGIWAGQAGVWVKYSTSQTWAYIGSSARDISAGKMAGGAWSAGIIELQEMEVPMGGLADGPPKISGYEDRSANSPGREEFTVTIENNLVPQDSRESKTGAPRIPGPGDAGFRFVKQKSLFPGSKLPEERN